jgi:hypothetical protein
VHRIMRSQKVVLIYYTYRLLLSFRSIDFLEPTMNASLAKARKQIEDNELPEKSEVIELEGKTGPFRSEGETKALKTSIIFKIPEGISAVDPGENNTLNEFPKEDDVAEDSQVTAEQRKTAVLTSSERIVMESSKNVKSPEASTIVALSSSPEGPHLLNPNDNAAKKKKKKSKSNSSGKNKNKQPPPTGFEGYFFIYPPSQAFKMSH